ncbi:hypothetical protein [Lysobacter gummosus]
MARSGGERTVLRSGSRTPDMVRRRCVWRSWSTFLFAKLPVRPMIASLPR